MQGDGLGAQVVEAVLMRTGDVFFGNDKIAPDQLTGKIKDRLANKTDKRVYIRADARAKFGRVVEVVDNIRAAGVDQLGLLTDQRKEKGAGGAPTTPAAAPSGGQ